MAGTAAPWGKTIRIYVIDDEGHHAAQVTADADGRFQLQLPAEGRLTLHAFIPGVPSVAVSAVPLLIDPKTSTTNLGLVLNQPGNSYLDAISKRSKAIR